MEYLFSLQNLREMSPQWINYFFIFISEILVRASIVAAVGIYWCINKKVGASILITYSGSYSLNQIIKNTACIYRPWILDSRLHAESSILSSATGYSFPSAHTVTASSIFGSIAAWFKEKKGVVITSFAFILFVAFSRNWLGAHTMTDVLVGIFEGCFMVVVSLFVTSYIEKNPSKDTAFAIIGILFAVLSLIILNFKSYPIDYAIDGSILADPYDMKTDCFSACGFLTGSLTGWWLERRFVNFNVEGTIKVKIIRFLIGGLIVGGIYLLFTLVFKSLNTHFSHFIKYFGMMFVGMYVYPLIFTKVESKILKK